MLSKVPQYEVSLINLDNTEGEFDLLQKKYKICKISFTNTSEVEVEKK